MRALLRNRWTGIGVGIGLVLLAGWAWTEREPLLAWYWSRCLAAAAPEEVDAWNQRLLTLDRARALAAVYRLLDHGSPGARDNAVQTLVALACADSDPRWAVYLTRLAARDFEQFAPAGQAACLKLVAALARQCQNPDRPGSPLPASWTETAGRMLLQVPPGQPGEGQLAALHLAWSLMRQEPPAQDLLGKPFVQASRSWAQSGLESPSAEVRGAAVRLAAMPELGLLEQVAALAAGPKRDPDPLVRSLALAAVVPFEEVLDTETLLPLLHDPDPEVRATCEHALRSRGLSAAHVQLARHMTDPEASIRAKVPAQVGQFPDLDRGVWWDRLSRDPSPAVRAAVIRAAAEAQALAQLQDRLQTLAQDDPSPTVRQIAHYYLNRVAPRRRRNLRRLDRQNRPTGHSPP